MSGAGEVNGKKPIQQTTQGVQQNSKPVQEVKPGNVPVGQSDSKPEDRGIRQDMGNGITKITHADGSNEFEIDYAKYDGSPQMFEKGTKITYKNVPEAPKEPSRVAKCWQWANETPEKPTLGDYALRTLRQAGAVLYTIGTGIGTLIGGPYGCSPKKDNVMHQELDYESIIIKNDTIPGTPATPDIPGTPETVVDAVLSADELKAKENELLTNTITAKNNSNPATADGVAYKYVDNGDGTGSVVVKNKDGSDSNIKLGFSIEFEETDQENDPKTGNYSSTLNMKATKTSTINNKNVYDYVNIIGDKFQTADNIGYKFTDSNGTIGVSVGDDTVKKTLGDKNVTVQNNVDYINKIGGKLETTNGVNYSFSVESGKAKVTYGDTGFTHIVGESAAVNDNAPLGKMQNMLTDMGILPDMNGKIATSEQTSTGAYQGKGIRLEVLPGDLKEVTTGNPTVRMYFNGISNHELSIEGKLSEENGVLTITANDGKKVTLTKQAAVNIGGDDYNNGISVAVNGRETFRIAKHDETNPNDKRVELAYVEDDGWSETTTNFIPQAPEIFDGALVSREADKYYKEKETNLKNALDEANIYFDTKKTNLEGAYKSAVEALKNSLPITKDGEVIPGTPDIPGNPGTPDTITSDTTKLTTHTEVDIDVTIR